ncbi:MAG: hypothetical protein E7324_04800 [Clostridiales bacterium]|nr:hypothetical protein [Clostridiales bacterium]
MAASRRRLAEPGYAGKLSEWIDPEDKNAWDALVAFIQPHMQPYMNPLFEKCGCPPTAFHLNNADLFEQITYEARDPEAVHQAAKNVLQHYGIKPDAFDVQVDYDSSAPHAANGTRGSFARGTIHGGTIRIVIEPSHSEYDTVIAIILHECAHAYLALHGISMSDPTENERLTDAAVLYLGGGDYLLRGYYPASNYRLGYLLKAECQAGMALIQQMTASRKGEMPKEEKAI